MASEKITEDRQKKGWKKEELNRRGFLQLAFSFIAGVASLAVGGVGARFLVGNSLVVRDKEKIALGPIHDLPAKQVHRLVYSFRAKDAWRESQQTGTVFAYSEDGRSYRILDGTCSHLGCIVRWKEAEDRFGCPCHAGFFSREGEVISGPPPKPLKVLEAVVENDILYVVL